jgi:hypothetical protein
MSRSRNITAAETDSLATMDDHGQVDPLTDSDFLQHSDPALSHSLPDPQTSFKSVTPTSHRSFLPSSRSTKRRRTSLDKTDRSTLDSIALSTTSQSAAQNVAPYLAKHIPSKYTPTGATPSIASTMEKKPIYCNRHRPDTKCWRQANEPTMEELQNVSSLMNVVLYSTLSIPVGTECS